MIPGFWHHLKMSNHLKKTEWIFILICQITSRERITVCYSCYNIDISTDFFIYIYKYTTKTLNHPQSNSIKWKKIKKGFWSTKEIHTFWLWIKRRDAFDRWIYCETKQLPAWTKTSSDLIVWRSPFRNSWVRFCTHLENLKMDHFEHFVIINVALSMHEKKRFPT